MSKHADELTRKDMKAPDAFQSAAAKAASWLTGKQQTIVAAVVGALVVIAVVLGAMAWMDSRKNTAGALLYRTLDDADGQISAVPLPGVAVPIFPSVEAQYRSVLGRADELRKTYPSTAAARPAALAAAAANLRLAALEKLQAQAPARADRAVLERARLLARSGKPDEAKKLLQAFPQDFKDSQLRADADKQLAALGGTP